MTVSPILERFGAGDLPWLVLRQQRGEFAHMMAGREDLYGNSEREMDAWSFAPDYAIVNATREDLDKLCIYADDFHPNDTIYAAVRELPLSYTNGNKRYIRREYGAETIFFRASSELVFDFLSAVGSLRREIFEKCRASAGGVHMVSCLRFPPPEDCWV